MTERDTEQQTDFEFDFFEEPDTHEAARPERTPRSGGPRRPVRPPQGLTPLLRLVGLIAFAILIVVLLVYAIQGCQSSSKRSKYQSYMKKAEELGSRSAGIGRQLNVDLTTPGLKIVDLERKVAGLARQQEQGVLDARDVKPPGKLRKEHEAMIEALQFRVSGLNGLALSLPGTVRLKDVGQASTILAAQAQRLLASDVVWDDSFKEPTKTVLKAEGLGISVPDSNFLANPDFASHDSMQAILGRIRGSSGSSGSTGTSSGPRGTNLVSVKALPSGTELSSSGDNIVDTSAELAFSVTVEDSGSSQEVRIPVMLTILQSPSPIVRKATIDFINPGEQKTVVLRGFGTVPVAQPTTLKVVIGTVPTEKITTNNTADYRITFSLPR
ncbi:MAG: hypothetical protein M3R70_11530 [Actinomycetota bacterium]|nr:hypothetical protein [Actinomycetota bacterium]